jgi:hypothetical protein
MLIRGLGPNGRLWQYECFGKGLEVEVYGGLLVERRGDIGSASPSFQTRAEAGPLHLQSDLYVEEAFSQEQGKAVFEWGFGFAQCLQQAIAEGLSEAEAALKCLAQSGSPPAPPPIALLGIASGLESGPVPQVLNSVTVSKGAKTLLVETP